MDFATTHSMVFLSVSTHSQPKRVFPKTDTPLILLRIRLMSLLGDQDGVWHRWLSVPLDKTSAMFCGVSHLETITRSLVALPLQSFVFVDQGISSSSFIFIVVPHCYLWDFLAHKTHRKISPMARAIFFFATSNSCSIGTYQ